MAKATALLLGGVLLLVNIVVAIFLLGMVCGLAVALFVRKPKPQ